jgi:hypothetical protein
MKYIKKYFYACKFYLLQYTFTLYPPTFYKLRLTKVRNMGSFYLFLYFCLGIVGTVYSAFLFWNVYMFSSLETLDLSGSESDISKAKDSILESMHRRKLCRYRAAQVVLTLIILLTSLF